MIDGCLIQVASGEYVNPLEPWGFTPRIDDIAHALAQINRFTGHTAAPYSVAEHSVRVSEACPPGLELAGLLHDAAEAYLGDCASPLKHHPTFGSAYRYAEDALQERIDYRFRVDSHHPAVRRADLVLLATEKRDLMPPGPEWAVLAGVRPLPGSINTWPPSFARRRFLARYHDLTSLAAAA